MLALLTYFASSPSWNLGIAIPMMIGALFGLVNFVVALLLGPETRGVEMVPTSSSPEPAGYRPPPARLPGGGLVFRSGRRQPEPIG